MRRTVFVLLLILQGHGCGRQGPGHQGESTCVNPRLRVHSFQATVLPRTRSEFMWPPRGRLTQGAAIGIIFNTLHYEECLGDRVASGNPRQRGKAPSKLRDQRNHMARTVSMTFPRSSATFPRKRTVILKIFLNISKEEQPQRWVSPGWRSFERTGNFRWATSPSARVGPLHGPPLRTWSGTPRTPAAMGRGCRDPKWFARVA